MQEAKRAFGEGYVAAQAAHERTRDWLLRYWPWSILYCLFAALLLTIDDPRVYRWYCYVLLLAPFLLALRRADVARLARSWVLCFSALYIAAVWLCLFWTPDMPASVFTHLARRLIATFLFAVLTAWLVWRDDRHALRLAWTIAWAALLTALVSLLFFPPSERYLGRLMGWLWPNPNTAGAVFGVAAVAAGCAAAVARRLSWTLVYGTLAIFLAVCILLTGSRAAMAGVTASFFAYVILQRAWRPLLALLAGVAAYAGTVAAGWIAPSLWLTRGDNGRFELWSHFAPLASQRLWLGYGLRNDLAFTIHNGLHTDDPHNMLLFTWFRFGLLGVLPWLALGATMLVVGLRHWRRSGDMMSLALSVFLLSHGLFESMVPLQGANWVWVYMWVPIGLAAGTELSLARPGPGAPGGPRPGSP